MECSNLSVFHGFGYLDFHPGRANRIQIIRARAGGIGPKEDKELRWAGSGIKMANHYQRYVYKNLSNL